MEDDHIPPLESAWEALAEYAQERLRKGTRVQILGRIDQQVRGEGAERQYKTVLVANEIVLISFAASEEVPAGSEPSDDRNQ